MCMYNLCVGQSTLNRQNYDNETHKFHKCLLSIHSNKTSMHIFRMSKSQAVLRFCKIVEQHTSDHIQPWQRRILAGQQYCALSYLESKVYSTLADARRNRVYFNYINFRENSEDVCSLLVLDTLYFRRL